MVLSQGESTQVVLSIIRGPRLTFESRVNPVEVLYAAFPAFMYIDPSLGAPLLEPLFRLQASPNYTIPFAAADLGGSCINVNVGA